MDKYRAWYFSRSRQNDQTYNYYDLEVTELPQRSLDVNNESRKEDFKTRVVIDRNNFHGMTCRVFEYTLPEDVLAVQSFHVYYEFFGGAIGLNHLSPTHQSFIVISSEDSNQWWTETYEEKLDEADMLKRAQGGRLGYQDIIANAKGGDTIQLWIETNGYAFARNIKAQFRVIKKFGQKCSTMENGFNGELHQPDAKFELGAASERSSNHPLMSKREESTARDGDQAHQHLNGHKE